MIIKQLAILRNFPNEFDTTYGPHYEQRRLMMGNNPVSFDEDMMIVHDHAGMTLPLMEMLFNKKLLAGPRPTEDDVSNYKYLLVTTQSIYKNNDIKQGPIGGLLSHL